MGEITIIYKEHPNFIVSNVKKQGKFQRILTLNSTDGLEEGDVLMWKKDALNKLYDQMVACVEVYENLNIRVEGINKKINKFAGDLTGELLKVGNIKGNAEIKKQG